ncbi:ATP-dependent DNA helicase, partial [Aphis craccivora]
MDSAGKTTPVDGQCGGATPVDGQCGGGRDIGSAGSASQVLGSTGCETVEKLNIDGTKIKIERDYIDKGKQGRNNSQLVDDEDWVLDDVLINDVGDYVENTNTSDVDSLKDGGKIIMHLIDNEQSQLWGKGHPAMKVFVTGPAGAGKSMLIRALAQCVIPIANLRPDIDDLSLPPVLLTAPTGKALNGIKGLTLHSAFKLPLNQFAGFLTKHYFSTISNTSLGTNNKVDEVNRRVLNFMNQASFISKSIDTSAKRSDIESAKKLSRQKTMGLTLRLVLKKTDKYIVIANISTKDGLVNRAIVEFIQINKGQTAG